MSGFTANPNSIFSVSVGLAVSVSLADAAPLAVRTKLICTVRAEKGQFKDFGADMFRDLSEAKRADIIRDGKAMSVALPGDINLLGMLKSTPQFARPMIPALVDSIVAGSIAQKIGLQKGDRIIAVNGKTIDSYNEFTNEVEQSHFPA